MTGYALTVEREDGWWIATVTDAEGVVGTGYGVGLQYALMRAMGGVVDREANPDGEVVVLRGGHP